MKSTALTLVLLTCIAAALSACAAADKTLVPFDKYELAEYNQNNDLCRVAFDFDDSIDPRQIRIYVGGVLVVPLYSEIPYKFEYTPGWGYFAYVKKGSYNCSVYYKGEYLGEVKIAAGPATRLWFVEIFKGEGIDAPYELYSGERARFYYA